MFTSFIEYPHCNECGGHFCGERHQIDKNGVFLRGDSDPGMVVSWPNCPRRYHTMYLDGQDVVDLSEICRWAIERDLHKRDDLTCGSELLLREHSRLRDLPAKLAEARAYAK
jgi:hypothetical protein